MPNKIALTPSQQLQMHKAGLTGAWDGAKFALRNASRSAANLVTMVQGARNAASNTAKYPWYLLGKAFGDDNWMTRIFAPKYHTGFSEKAHGIADWVDENLPYSDYNKTFIQRHPAMRTLGLVQKEALQSLALAGAAKYAGKGLSAVGKGIKSIPKVKSVVDAASMTAKPIAQKLPGFMRSNWFNRVRRALGSMATGAQVTYSVTGVPLNGVKQTKWDPAIKETIDWLGWLNPHAKWRASLLQSTPAGKQLLTGMMRKQTADKEKMQDLFRLSRYLAPDTTEAYTTVPGIQKQIDSTYDAGQIAEDIGREVVKEKPSYANIRKIIKDRFRQDLWDPIFNARGYLPLRRRLIGYPGAGQAQAFTRDATRAIGHTLSHTPDMDAYMFGEGGYPTLKEDMHKFFNRKK